MSSPTTASVATVPRQDEQKGASPTAFVSAQRAGLLYRSIDDVCQTAQTLFKGGIQPKGVDRWERLVPMLLTGAEVGLGAMQSIECVTPPVNGRCSLYGDAGLALVRASGQLVAFDEAIEGDGDDRRAVCKIQRVGFSPKTFEYTFAQARKLTSFKKATEDSPWRVNPDNMLKWRARWLALRTEFTDVLKGLVFAEVANDEVQQVPEVTVTAATDSSSSYSSPSSTQPIVVDEMVDELQLKELLFLRGSMMAAKAIHDPAEQKTEWAKCLEPFKVSSAKELTKVDAAMLIESLAKVHDFPKSSTGTPTA